MSTINTIKNLANFHFKDVVEFRRHIHQHPELSFQEFKTSEFVCSILDKHSISYTKGIVKTGVVAIIEGKKPSKKTILIRADLDALPIEEKNSVKYISKNSGVMQHADMMRIQPLF